MISAKIPLNEDLRLQRLRELDILDTVEENSYDDLTLIAAQICGTPIALVSLIDINRQWFKSHHGLAARETPRDVAFCSHAILDDDVFVIEDAFKDERFRDNPLAVDNPHVRFYAGAPLIVEKGLRLGTLCVIDHVPRKLSKEQYAALAALSRQVVHLLKLRKTILSMQKLDEEKDGFVSMVSHELRTPLTAINGSIGLLKSALGEKIAAPVRSLVEIATRNSDRLNAIVNDILDLAKVEAGKLEMKMVQEFAHDIARQAVELNQPYCQKCGTTLDLKIEVPDDVQIRGDRQRLLQVLSNLISNAAKFSPDGVPVDLSVTMDGESRVAFSVTDRGPGISEADRKKLFQRFSQVGDGSNKKLPGTGLGLVICKYLVESHGGRVSVTSTPFQATTFSFSLPRL